MVERSFMRVRGFSWDSLRCWTGRARWIAHGRMRPLITPKGSKGIEQENADGPTHSISLSPLPAIHSSRRWKLIDAGAMYVCVLLLPAAIITVLYITQMLLLLDGDTLRVALLLQLDRCNQFLQLLFHHTFGWCNWSPVLPSSTVARPSAYFKTCQTFFGKKTYVWGLCCEEWRPLRGRNNSFDSFLPHLSLSLSEDDKWSFILILHASFVFIRSLLVLCGPLRLSFFFPFFFPLTKRARAFQLVG